MSFIDAEKLNNWTYCDYRFQVSYSGPVTFVVNMACRGALVQDDSEDPHVIEARKPIEEVGKDGRVDGVVMQILSENNWDGFYCSRQVNDSHHQQALKEVIVLWHYSVMILVHEISHSFIVVYWHLRTRDMLGPRQQVKL